ncbi:hypothetical protein V5799_009352 [Amblyomma americanum]|uniref:Uncharacterized protein n=1 Tax=Amblyomma americanum TaxID=6943 RepID=A0AAQ4FC69_AMBAM
MASCSSYALTLAFANPFDQPSTLVPTVMSRAGSPRSGTPSAASVSFSMVPATGVASTDEVQTGGSYVHGSYQRRTLSFGIAAMVALLCYSQSFTLISGPVDHWCKPPPQFSHLLVETWKNVGIPLDERGGYSQC